MSASAACAVVVAAAAADGDDAASEPAIAVSAARAVEQVELPEQLQVRVGVSEKGW